MRCGVQGTLVVAALAVAAPDALGDAGTWSGAGGTNNTAWSEANNWVESTIPGTVDDAYF